jgi:hypothetical protein
MNGNSYKVLVAKEYETQQDGKVVKKTAWNRVGRAWKSQLTDTLNFELFLIPNQRYVIAIQDRDQEAPTQNEVIPF